MSDADFMECATCRAKPGAPLLCQACLHNRRLVGELRTEIERMRPVYEIACGRWRTGHAAQVGSWPFQRELAGAVDAALAKEPR
jgi:hypothetical protein